MRIDPRIPVAVAVCCATLGLATAARAGLPEDLRDVAFHPTNPDCYAAVYALVGGGLVLTCDDGESFELLCASGVLGDITLDASQPRVAYTDDDHLLVGHFDGLFRGDVNGCGFARVEGDLGEAIIRDVVVDPQRPGRVYALSSSGAGDNGIHVSTDGGESWRVLGELEPHFFSRLRFAPLSAGEQRMVVSLGKPSADFSKTDYFVRVSDDDGETFVEQAFPDADDMRLLGVDQADPDRFYALAQLAGEAGLAVMVNAEAGAQDAWERLGEVQEMGSFLTLPEGGFWAADVLQRRLVHSVDGASMEVVNGTRDVSCFAQRPADGQLFTCRSDRFYRANAKGESQGERLFSLAELERFVQCGPDGSVASLCLAQMDAGYCSHHFRDAPVCSAEGGTGEADGGGADAAPPDAGADAADSTGGGGGGGGCSAGGGPVGAGACLGLGVLALWRRRRPGVARG